MKEKEFIRPPIYPIFINRKWFNPFRYLLGKETYRLSADVNEYVAQIDLDTKDIKFTNLTEQQAHKHGISTHEPD